MYSRNCDSFFKDKGKKVIIDNVNNGMTTYHICDKSGNILETKKVGPDGKPVPTSSRDSPYFNKVPSAVEERKPGFCVLL